MARPALADDPLMQLATLALLASGELSKTGRAQQLGNLLGRPPVSYEAMEGVVDALKTRSIGRQGLALADLRQLGVERHLLSFRCPPADRVHVRAALTAERSVARVWACEGRDDFVAEVVGSSQEPSERLIERYRPEVSLRVLDSTETLDEALLEALRMRREEAT